jgi:hypothetical protein
MTIRDFDIDALYVALDAERQSRRLSWQQLTREINDLFAQVRTRPISASTLRGMRGRATVEGNGVLQMLLWLDRTPESFVAGHPSPNEAGAKLARVGPRRILRFDAASIFVALDAQRVERAMTWAQVANDIGGINASSLTRLSNGGLVAFPAVVRIATWLKRPVAHFTRAFDR